MSISSISSSYTSALYQWQNQQLTSSGSTSSQSSTGSSLSSLLGSYSITSQVSSMVELTQYAMDAMGLSDDSRVTFNQILTATSSPANLTPACRKASRTWG